MFSKRIGFLFIFIFSFFISHSQWKNLPVEWFYESKYKGYLIAQGDSIVELGYRHFELYEVRAELFKFQYNKATNSFRIKGATILDNHVFPQISIYKKKGVMFRDFTQIGSSSDTGESFGKFDLVFQLEDGESLLVGFAGTVLQNII